jgi:hypothetical protein
MEAIQAFVDGNTRCFHKLNNALIVLLPKWNGANSPQEFRPITMIHSFAKLISKILDLRLAPRLKDLIDRNQNAFIQKRLIHDNFKYVQRAAVLIRKKKIPMMLLKLDISKAFDTLSWPFLLDVLKAKGFRPRWCTWMESMLSSATSRIILNGQQGPKIQHMRGVRQGDSLYGGEDKLEEIVEILGCQVQPFPIRYLGLPLSTKAIPKAGFQSVVEQVARKLPPCQGSLMARSGRLV